MANSLQEERQLRDLNRHLRAQGVEGNFDFHLNNKAQWYKADGTPLPTLLPVDEYHRQLYMSKGWTLSPPREPVAVQSGPSLIEQELERNKQLAEAKEKGRGLSPIETEIQREIKNSVEPPKEVIDFLRQDRVTEAEPSEPVLEGQVSLAALSCTEPECDYQAQGNTARLRKVRLEKHIYGPFSKHKKEKQDG